MQARSLLRIIGETPRSRAHLEAFFALMYFAALRPEEARNLRKEQLSLPAPRRDSETGECEFDWDLGEPGRTSMHCGQTPARWARTGR
ncbi:hypothetical protein AB0J55_30275 [Amycolatopsis sp. NPDC049688]|uniref:hypothetical protein n=1 Tax=Amycolatopsis sp. NPDC049688 TaxID=3154733 RepID=UPI003440DC7D